MRSCIFFGGLSMANQLPIHTLTEQEWSELIAHINGSQKPVEPTKVGAIPANFFFSL